MRGGLRHVAPRVLGADFAWVNAGRPFNGPCALPGCREGHGQSCPHRDRPHHGVRKPPATPFTRRDPCSRTRDQDD
ncbi:hypothetical protein BQ8420_08680 [Nocardiopsis sp. JB363]|nr:hypothetical protein BQ8420_08680 [Nocardiopsis sp. JB363]